MEEGTDIWKRIPAATGMHQPTRTRFILGGTVVLAILVRVAVGIATESWTFSAEKNHWEFGYEMGRVAGCLVAGQGFAYPTDPPQPTAWMAPAYPVFVAAVFLAFGPHTPQSALAIQFIQVIASALSCVLLYLLGKRLYGPTVGEISAFLLAIYPASIHYAVQKIWSSSFFTVALLSVLFLFTIQARRPSTTGVVFLGVMLGIGVLFNPLLLSIIPPMTAWLYWVWKKQGQGDPVAIVLLLATCGLVLTPWVVRNYAVFGRFVLIKSNLGHEILVGNHEHAMRALPDEMSGIERQVRGLKQPIKGLMMTETELEVLRELNEVEKNCIYLRNGMRSITDNPVRFLRFTGIRIASFWTTMRSPKGVKELVFRSPYFLVLSLGLFGIFLAVKKGLPRAVLIIPILFFPVAYYVTVVGLHRYRFPIEPIFLIFAALAIAVQVPRLGLKSIVGRAGKEPRLGFSVHRHRREDDPAGENPSMQQTLPSAIRTSLAPCRRTILRL
jgi:4-amino-4-deoxy-L-arabinose transferase-like glycosyltransferase